ncbi:helix-turn-helix transcriptional regulator [Sinomonas terrae]|uniref:Helix-turn-helix transcriptional regulator n=1 Tax=Sinomonas terrae TaxID=2908838 RepID=A0ABS9TX95_9MICC|nr:helix-turn-helix transcriptional regulator [Sinomonas terrae]MCH6469044.1 helix-turn-helix transcriptional regulator [Sinomonas terrae]
MERVSSPVPERYRRLGEFLRLKRERLLPDEVGLPSSGRRRTQGLRREEVASIANVGVSWYTWLEQGRAAGASIEVLDAVAAALRLDADEHRYVLGLARVDGGARVLEPSPADYSRYAGLAETITAPAYVIDPCWRVIATNNPARECFETEIGKSRLEKFFLESDFSTRFLNEDLIGRSLVEQFRAQSARYPEDLIFDRTAQRLRARSALFRKYWDLHVVGESYREDITFRHAKLGLLTFEPLSLTFDDEAQLRLITYLPGRQARMSSAGSAREAK